MEGVIPFALQLQMEIQQTDAMANSHLIKIQIVNAIEWICGGDGPIHAGGSSVVAKGINGTVAFIVRGATVPCSE
jgi:hypothetical protein